MKVLALDFDGVISDSAPECFAVALHVYTALRPGSALVAARERLAPGDAPDAGWRREVLQADALYNAFLELMPLGNRAEDFGVALAILDAGAEVPDQAAYDAHHAAQSQAWLERFHRLFYELRHSFARRAPVAWRALMGPYPFFVEILRRRAGDAWLAIATAKDRESIDLLLRDYGLRDLFPEERVLDKETGVSKRAHLQEIRARSNAPTDAITFVDDKVNHLERVADLGVRCALATWGYNGLREQRRARDLGFALCDEKNAEELLLGPAPAHALRSGC